MADRVSEVLLRYKVDKQSSAETAKSARDIRGALDDIGRSDAIKQAAKDFARYAVETKKAERAADLFNAQLKEIGASDSEIKSAARAFREYRKEIENADDATRRLNQSQDRFDATSRKVALAGDFQSNLGAVRGLSGIAGLGGAGEGIGAAGEIVALAEELPRLKEAALGLPGVIGAAVTAMGPLGLVALPLAAAGAFGLSKALEEMSRRQKEAEDRTRQGLETQREYFELISSGTSEDVQGAIDDLRQRNAVLQQFRDSVGADIQRLASLTSGAQGVRGILSLTSALEDLDDVTESGQISAEQLATLFSENLNTSLEESGRLVSELQAIYGEGALNIDVLKDSFKSIGGEITANDRQMQLLTDALDRGATAAADAAEAERVLAEARTSALLQMASAEAQTLAAQQQAAARDVAGNQARIKQIQELVAVYQTEIDVLSQSGDTSEQVTQRITQLNQQLELLGREAGNIAELLPSQEFAERAKANKEQAVKAVEEEKALADERTAVAENLRNELKAIALATARSQLEAFEKLQENIASLEGDLVRDLANANEQAGRDALQSQLDFQRQQAEADIAHYRTLEDLRRKFERDEQDAALDRDFRRLFELRQQRQREFEDAARARQEQITDDANAFNQQAADRAAALQQERQDLIAAAVIRRMEIQADYQKQLQVIRENQARQLVELQEKYGIELQLRQAGHSQEAQLLQSAIQEELNMRQRGYQAELTLLSQFIGDISLLSLRSTGTSTPTPITKTAATGGTTNTPSVPVTPKGGGGGSAKSIHITINGNNEDRILQVVNRGLTA